MTPEEKAAIRERLRNAAQGDQEGDMEFTLHVIEDMGVLLAEVDRLNELNVGLMLNIRELSEDRCDFDCDTCAYEPED
jgi:hypothetical protein